MCESECKNVRERECVLSESFSVCGVDSESLYLTH